MTTATVPEDVKQTLTLFELKNYKNGTPSFIAIQRYVEARNKFDTAKLNWQIKWANRADLNYELDEAINIEKEITELEKVVEQRLKEALEFAEYADRLIWFSD